MLYRTTHTAAMIPSSSGSSSSYPSRSNISTLLFKLVLPVALVGAFLPSLAGAFSPAVTTSTTRTDNHNKKHRLKMASSSSSSPDHKPPKHVIIVGGGVIGTCTSYYLAHTFGIASTIIDVSGQIAPAASGKAGGFLALDWNDTSPLRKLARRSFALHQTLADTLGAESIQYRRLTCVSIGVDQDGATAPRSSAKKLEGVEWAVDAAKSIQTLGDETTIAQVHPKLLCHRLWEKSCQLVEEKRKTNKDMPENKLMQGKVTSLSPDGVKLEDGSVVNGDAVLVSCGPWTSSQIMTGIKYHSVLVPTEKVLSQCVFFSGMGDPEVYVRPDSTAYCTGFPDAPISVTEQPGQEEVRPEAVDRILTSVRAASGKTQGEGALSAEPTLTQSCYLPSTPDGLPIMGRLAASSNNNTPCYVAAGHGCWGILLAPATGETMAHLIATGQTSTEHVTLNPFEPARFGNIQPFV